MTMTAEDLAKRIVTDCGADLWPPVAEWNGRLIEALAKELREAINTAYERCAKIADDGATSIRMSGLKGGEPNAYESACEQIASRIRSLKDKG